MKARSLSAGIIAAVAAAVVGVADDGGTDERKKPGAGDAPAHAESPDEKALRARAEAFTKAFNAGDARAVARLFTPDARAIDVTGEVAEGREAIEREYAALFEENPGLRIEVQIHDLHLVSADAAVEEGTTRVVPKNGAPPVNNRYSAVSVKRDGEWLVADARESPGELSAHDQVKVLEWLVGEWVDESSDSAIHSTCRWADDKQALIRKFTIQTGGKVVMTGTQRIGWDPCAEQIKSWEFDSEGGHGEGLWSRLGDQWIVKARAILRDGRTATATHVITPEDASTCRWRTTDRTVGSQVIPMVEEFVMVRPSPGPRAK